jgi:hypothetical protein
MSDSRPITPIDQFLLSHGYEPSTPIRDVVQQQPQPQPRTPSRQGYVGNRYFVTDEMLDGRPRTTVVPAGTSAYQVENPMPDRPTFESEMAARNELAWEVERQNRMSGSHTISNARARAREGWEPHLVRDSSGRLRTDWSRVGSDVPRDPSGRPHPTTDVDGGRFQPGADLF